ncbi:MAG: hypothetical protein E7231_09355 [Cellulosilyticum sp.]|nr:hypothetical protein [Cellulosilyticum sp.]
MCRIIEIMPLIGIKWGNNAINILDSSNQVKSILGEPESIFKKSYYYFNSDLRIDFDENNCVEFIEFLAGINGKLQPIIYGIKAFETDVDNLYDILKEKNNGEIYDELGKGYAYAFLNISVGIFRQNTPAQIKEMTDEMIKEGIDIQDNEDLEIEKQKAFHWATIGIGGKGYYKEVM